MVALADAGLHRALRQPAGLRRATARRSAKAIEGNWGEADDSDLMRLVDWALRQKLATRGSRRPARASYGGYMTNWLLGHHPGRFAARQREPRPRPLLVLRRVRLRVHDRPARRRCRRARGTTSPACSTALRAPQLHRNTAPLLLLQAEGDLRCPAGQTEIAFTMMRRLGRTVEMVRYPRGVAPDAGGRAPRPARRPSRADASTGSERPQSLSITGRISGATEPLERVLVALRVARDSMPRQACFELGARPSSCSE